ncbi:hypothetical protein [Haloarchaeobius sp. HME9146]|uniref:hypothetical protein n=1 Tax=Haloarchaeobius sp. HME9146 TaxID=2978732 RepID=UPI0021BE3A4A|nr:hypothetical protein [Haloarchaeobius sp. HME9146]MCT9097441.1 hypothetical protein [Haloarchaeobius sp. HME9146]
MYETRSPPRSFAGSVLRLTAVLLGLALLVPATFFAWYFGIVAADLLQLHLGLEYGLWFHVVTGAVFVLESALLATVVVAFSRLVTDLADRLKPTR